MSSQKQGRDDGAWTTIESDPGVFTELIESMGAEGVQVEEVWSFDKESLLQLRPVYGLIFLFKWRSETDNRPVAEDTLGSVFFANQVIPNACATQAILSVLLNCPEGGGMALGAELSNFKAFTSDFPPDMKGLAISNSDSIRTAHNNFARPEPIVPDEDAQHGEKEDAFHFIAYMPVAGQLYELDGLKQGPIPLGPCSTEDPDEWLGHVVPHIQARISRYAASEIRFNLMAVIRDRRTVATERIAALQAERERLLAAATGDDVAARLVEVDMELASTQEDLARETEKRARWHAENVRRRHNYIPFLFNLLKFAAEKGQLQPLIDAANAKTMSDD